MFAKLFESAPLGQILFILDTTEEGVPQVSCKFQPPDMGVCTITPTFDATEAGWAAAKKLFDGITKESAEVLVTKTIKQILDAAETTETLQ